jgi:soluble lytic murein transglycosylase-like protein
MQFHFAHPIFVSGFLCLVIGFTPSAHAFHETSLREKIQIAAAQASLDPRLVEAVVRTESNFSERATSPKGAKGLMQVMPQTAEECGIASAYHGMSNLLGACRCLRQLINRFDGNLRLALAAYNAGPRNVERYRGIPPFRETQQYVEKVLRYYQELKTPSITLSREK